MPRGTMIIQGMVEPEFQKVNAQYTEPWSRMMIQEMVEAKCQEVL